MGSVKLKNIMIPQHIFKLYLDKKEYQCETNIGLRENQEQQGIDFIDANTYKQKIIQSVAILYLDNLGHENDDIICYSISDNLITDLKKVSSLRVPSFNDVKKYKGSNLPLSEIARSINVENIITS